MLVLLDGVNAWDGGSEFVDAGNRCRPLPARRLATVDALSTFQHVAPSNGASVWCTTAHATPRALPQHLNLRKVHALQLRPYSLQQLERCLVHYHVSGALLQDVNRALVARVRNLSGAIPRIVRQIAAAY